MTELPPTVELEEAFVGYDVGELLSAAGGTWLYRATRRVDGAAVVVKLAVGDDRARGSLRREAEALGRLDHPNVVRLVEDGERSELGYVVVEHQPGGSLGLRLRNEPFAVEEVVAVGSALVAALSHAHEHGVLHCDVQPANVLFDGGGTPKLADFGISVLGSGPLTDRGQSQDLAVLAGTPWFMAPEQVRGEALGPATDVFGLGTVLYLMLAGRLPVPYEDEPRVACGHQVETLPEPLTSTAPWVSSALADAVMATLAKRYEERPSTATEFAHMAGW